MFYVKHLAHAHFVRGRTDTVECIELSSVGLTPARPGVSLPEQAPYEHECCNFLSQPTCMYIHVCTAHVPLLCIEELVTMCNHLTKSGQNLG